MAGRGARDRRPAGDARSTASSAHAARPSTPPTSSCRGCCTPPSFGRRTRTPASHASTSRPRSRRPACTRRSAPATSTCSSTSAGSRAPRSQPSAQTRYAQARAAVAAIDIDFEQLEVLLDPDEAVARGAARSASRASAAAATSSAGSPKPTSSSQASTRPRSSCTTRWRRTSRSCSGSATRSRSTSRRSTSGACATSSPRTLGLPADKVRVVCNYMGGGFGSKNGADDYTFIAIELAKRTHRPVRCALTRREENLATGNRNATIQRLTIGARADGTLTALGGEYVNATGWDGWSSPVEGPMQMLYACDNVKTTTWAAKINQPPMKAFRAPGFVEGTFGLESLLDVLAAKLDLDPLELRRRNHANHDASDGRPYSGKNLLECYRRAEPHWERRHEVRARSTDDRQARRRHGLADLVRRRRPAELRVGSCRLGRSRRGRHRDAGHRHRHAHRDGADRRRGARDPARSRHGRRSATPPAAPSRRSRPARRRRPSMGPAVRAAADASASRSRQIEEIAASSAARPDGAARPRSSACSRTRRSSARAGAGRTPPACRC